MQYTKTKEKRLFGSFFFNVNILRPNQHLEMSLILRHTEMRFFLNVCMRQMHSENAYCLIKEL